MHIAGSVCSARFLISSNWAYVEAGQNPGPVGFAEMAGRSPGLMDIVAEAVGRRPGSMVVVVVFVVDAE